MKDTQSYKIHTFYQNDKNSLLTTHFIFISITLKQEIKYKSFNQY